jgi:hypothetical protein
MKMPNHQVGGRDPNDSTHPVAFRFERALPQEPTDILGHYLFLHIKVNQTVPLMKQAPIIEVAIEGKEGWPIQMMQKRNDFVIFHPLSPNVQAYLPDGNSLAPQYAYLAVGDVFIQHVHACRDS